jgi:hypothetical protein
MLSSPRWYFFQLRRAPRKFTLLMIESSATNSYGEDMRNKNGWKLALGVMAVIGALLMAVDFGIAREKYETIDGTVFGTGSQMGQNVGITFTIYDYSNADDRAILVQAFQKGQNQGLANALQKMRAVGHISITGTLGYDVSFIRMIPTETGRKIRFVTNRKIGFGEAWADSQSMDFNLTAGEFIIDSQNKSKSTGTLFPATQLTIGDNAEPTWQLNQNSWRIAGIIDWQGTSGVN